MLPKISGFLPMRNIMCSIFYGSAAVKQANYNGKMLDILLLVDDKAAFHKENINVNPNHYSYIGTKFSNSFLILYNSHAKFGDTLVKYGVANYSDAIEDLSTWKYMFFAGRMQKHVILNEHRETNIMKYITDNRRMAAALVLLGMDEFSWDKFLLDLVSISYIGDIRFLLHAESLSKMRNIANGSRDQLISIYQPIYNELKALSKQQLREILPPAFKENIWERIKTHNTKISTHIALCQLLTNKPTNIYMYCKHKLTTK